MSSDEIVRGWKDPDSRSGDLEVGHPAGDIELIDPAGGVLPIGDTTWTISVALGCTDLTPVSMCSTCGYDGISCA
jgi:hypothetical protein